MLKIVFQPATSLISIRWGKGWGGERRSQPLQLFIGKRKLMQSQREQFQALRAQRLSKTPNCTLDLIIKERWEGKKREGGQGVVYMT